MADESIALLRESLALLRSIDTSLKLLVRQQSAAAPGAVATDRDLDGKYGDPVLKVVPRDWTGPSFKNCKLSECPAALLDMAAEMFEYFAKKADDANERTNGGKPVGDYRRADAARARGWAKRKRAGLCPEPVGAGMAEATGGVRSDNDWD